MGWTGIPENEHFNLDRCIDERLAPDEIVALARGPWGPDGCAYCAAVRIETPKETAPYVPDADGSITIGCVILYDRVRREHYKEHLFKVIEKTEGPTRQHAPAFLLERLSRLKEGAELDGERQEGLAKWAREWRAAARANAQGHNRLPDENSRVRIWSGTEAKLTGRMKGYVATFNTESTVKVEAITGDAMVIVEGPETMVIRDWRAATTPARSIASGPTAFSRRTTGLL